MAVQVVSGVFVARLAGVERIGWLAIAGLISPYLTFLWLGLNDGLNRQLPLYLGKKDYENAQKYADIAWLWANLVGTVSFIVLVVAGLYFFFWADNIRLGEACLALAILAILSNLSGVIEIAYRTHGHFIQLSKFNLWESLFALLSVLLVYYSRWYGMLIRLILIGVLHYVLVLKFAPLKMKISFSRQHFKILLAIGIPFLVIGYLGTLTGNVNRTLLVKYFGAIGIGLYAPANQIFSALQILATSIQRFIYPKMCLIFGETEKSRALAKLVYGPYFLVMLATLPVFAFGWWFTKPFISWALPDYIEGTSAARWMVISAYLSAILQSVVAFFYTTKRLYLMIVIKSLAFIIAVAFTIIGVEYFKMGIEAPAVGICASAIFTNIVVLLCSVYYIYFKDKNLNNIQF